jgi:hypothetical protein
VVVAEAVMREEAAEVAEFATSCLTVRIKAECLEELDSGFGKIHVRQSMILGFCL